MILSKSKLYLDLRREKLQLEATTQAKVIYTLIDKWKKSMSTIWKLYFRRGPTVPWYCSPRGLHNAKTLRDWTQRWKCHADTQRGFLVFCQHSCCDKTNQTFARESQNNEAFSIYFSMKIYLFINKSRDVWWCWEKQTCFVIMILLRLPTWDLMGLKQSKNLSK